MLFSYLQALQQFLGDTNEQRFNLADLTQFVNRARQKVAGATQCIRVLPPSSGHFTAMSVAAGGSGYTSPTVTISPPDAIGVGFTQATATATVSGGAITGFSITNPGTGYVQPTITITDSTGTGASASYTLSSFLTCNPAQEVYTFASVNPIIQANFPGVSQIIAIQSVAISWGSWKPAMRNYPWSMFQAYCRAWNIGEQNYPTVWSQYGQGQNGSIYLYPIPSVIGQMDWDCYCVPIDLALDTDVEAIPHPFTEAVPYYAAFLAFMSAQNQDAAMNMRGLYKQQMAEARGFVSPPIIPDMYESGL